MRAAQIAALLAPFIEQPLAPSQLRQISAYLDLLLRWNARINLTAIRHEDEILARHFGESFFLARHLFPAERAAGAPPKLRLGGGVSGSIENRELRTENWELRTAHCPPRVLDIGSGAGFPALPLKLWAPGIHLTLIESNHKKAAFLREAARTLALTNINVIAARAESLSARPAFPKAAFVTLRAVERFPKILPLAVSFLAPNGTLALLIGSAHLPLLSTQTIIKWNPPIPIPQSHSSVLAIGIKT
jgi:16S rRNA (guanine527-N7)-methyltransferase